MQLINDMEEQLDEVLLSSVVRLACFLGALAVQCEHRCSIRWLLHLAVHAQVEACVRIGKPDLLNTKLRRHGRLRFAAFLVSIWFDAGGAVLTGQAAHVR